MYSFSPSAIKTWMTCRELYRLRYIEQLEPVAPAIHLVFGRAMHKAPEAFWSGKSAETAFAMALEVTREIDPFALDSKTRTRWLGLLDSMGAMIQTYYEATAHHDGLNGCLIEHEFHCAPNDRWEINGRIDQFLKADGRFTLRDLKTASEVGTDWKREYRESLLRNWAITVYDWYLRQISNAPTEIGFEVLIKPYRGSEPRYEYFDLSKEIIAYRKRTDHLLYLVCEEMADYHDKRTAIEPWPMTEDACAGRYNDPCAFRPLCNHGQSEATVKLYKIKERKT